MRQSTQGESASSGSLRRRSSAAAGRYRLIARWVTRLGSCSSIPVIRRALTWWFAPRAAGNCVLTGPG